MFSSAAEHNNFMPGLPCCRVPSDRRIISKNKIKKISRTYNIFVCEADLYCEAQARVRQGWARDGP